MNKRFMSVVAFGLVVAAGASFILYQLITSRMTANASAATTPVVVAGRDMVIGTLIKESDLKLAAWPGTPPQGAASKIQDVAGRGVTALIVDGEPVLNSRLAPRGAGAGLAATIPQGMRAVAISVNEVVGVAGFVVPGMRVDILISGNPPGMNNSATGTQARTVLQNIEVLSAGQNIQKDSEGKPIQVQVVNLLVTPEQAEIMSLASHETRIQLVLRNPIDTEISKTSGTTVANLFGGKGAAPNSAQAPPPVAEQQPRPYRPPPPPRPVVIEAAAPKPPERVYIPIVVEVINGTRRTDVKFANEGEAKKQ